MTPSSFKRILFTLILALSAMGFAQQPVPVVSGTGSGGLSGSGLLGTTATLHVTFENDNATIGFGPFVQFILPAEFGGVPGGISFSSASYEGLFGITPIIYGPVTEPGGETIKHPYGSGAVDTITLGQGDTLYILPLPFGSYTDLQGGANIRIGFNIADNAIPTEHDFQLQGGFRFGDSPTGTNGQIVGSLADASITPRVIIGEKEFNYHDNSIAETAIGPTNVRTFTLEALIAPGQTVTELVFTDILPNDVVVLGNFTIDGTDDSPSGEATISSVTINTDTTDIKEQDWTPGDEGTDWPKAAGTKMHITVNGELSGIVTITYDVYYPFADVDGNPVHGTSRNDLEVHAVWSHETHPSWQNQPVGDGRASLGEDSIYKVVHVENNQEPQEIELSSSLKIQKSVKEPSASVSSYNQGQRTVLPGEVYDFRLEIQFSDMSAYDEVVVRDVLGDGLEFVTGTDLSINARLGNGSLNFTHLIDPDWISLDLSNGEQTMLIPLSELLKGEGVAGGRIVGACVDHVTGEIENDVSKCLDTIEVVIDYQAQVLPRYRYNGHAISQAGEMLLQGDVLRNDVAVDAQALKHNGTGFEPADNQAAPFADDTSFAVFSLANSAPSKSVVLVNNEPFDPDTMVIEPGDLVTFELFVKFPTGNVGNFILIDHLPHPAFDVAAEDFDIGSSAGPYAANEISYIDIPAAWDASVKTTLPTRTGNTLTFNFGSLQDDEDYEGGDLVIYVTVEVVGTAMADDLLLTNQLVVSEADNGASGEPTTALALTQLTYGRPVLNITNTVFADYNAPHVPGGTLTPIVSGSCNDLAPDLEMRDCWKNDTIWQNELDANDVVTVFAVVENTGLGQRGAFDLEVELVVPDELSHETDLSRITIWHGDNNAPLIYGSDYTVTPSGIGNNTLTIKFANPGGGPILTGGISTDGSNILVIAYEVHLDDGADGVGYDSIYDITANITEYRHTSGSGPNLAGNIYLDDESGTTSVETRTLTATKAVIATSQPDDITAGKRVAIGEIITYEVVLTIPEGQSDPLIIGDQLPAGLMYVGTPAVTGSSTGVTYSSVAIQPCDVDGEPDPTGEILCFTFANLIVDNNKNGIEDGTITLQYDVQVLNKNGPTGGRINAAGNTRRNNVYGIVEHNRTEPVPPTLLASETVTIVEPGLKITKEVDPVGVSNTNNLQAGDQFTYTITVGNSGANATPVFDVVMSDTIDNHFQIVDITVTSTTVDLADIDVTPTTYPTQGGTVTATLTTADGRLDVGQEFKVAITVKVLQEALTGVTVPNTARVVGFSIPGGDTSDGWDQRRKYEPTANASVALQKINSVKTVVVTDQGFTTDAPAGIHTVAVGEVVTYRLASHIPRGTSREVQIIDDLPVGMTHVLGSDIRYYVYADTTDLSELAIGPATWAINTTTTPPANTKLTQVVPSGAVATATNVTVTIDEIVNIVDGDAIIYIEYDAYINGVALGNLDNDFDVTSKDEDGNEIDHDPSDPVTVHAVAPDLAVTKAVTGRDRQARISGGDVTNVDLGETLTFTITTRNVASHNEAIGWGYSLVDELPGEFIPPQVSQINVYVNGAYATGNFDITVVDQEVRVFAKDSSETGTNAISLKPGATPTVVTVTFPVEVREDVAGAPIEPGDDFDNTAEVYTYTLPGVQPDISVTDPAVPAANPVDPIVPAGSVMGVDAANTKIAEPDLSITKVFVVPEKGPEAHPNEDTYKFEIRLRVENKGLINLHDVQILEDLTIYNPGTVAIDGPIVVTYFSAGTSHFVLNSAFDGLTDTELLDSAASHIVAGARIDISIPITVTFTDVDQVNEDYVNIVRIEAETLGGLPAENDDSDISTPTQTPKLSVVKSIIPDSNGDDVTVDPTGEYTITFALDVVNSGDVPVYDLQVTDNLRDVLNAGRPTAVGNIAITNVVLGQAPIGGTYTDKVLTLAPSYVEATGVLLAGTDILLPNEGRRITLTATFVPDHVDWLKDPAYENVASASGEQKLRDSTNNPAPVTADSNIQEFLLDEEASIGISTALVPSSLQEQAGAPTGTYEFAIDVTIENYGIVNLDDISALLDFYATQSANNPLGDALNYTVSAVTVVSGEPLTPNGAFDGDTDTDLLAPVQHLAPGENTVIRIVITDFVPAPNELTYQLTAKASADTPLDTVADDSNDGYNPDVGGGIDATADNDGDPTNNTAPTIISFGINSAIAIAKEVTRGPIAQVDGDGLSTGVFELDYTFHLENLGNDQLNNVQINDDFAATFPGATNFSITAITATGPVTVTTTTFPITTLGDVALLDAANSSLLSAAQAGAAGNTNNKATVTVTLELTPSNAAATQVYNNSAFTEGTHPGDPGNPVTDKSNDGDTPDPTDDTPTPVSFENPGIEVTKSLESHVYDNKDSDTLSDHEVTAIYKIVVENTGDVALTNVQVIDDLATVFPGSLGSVTVTATGLTAVTTYSSATGELLTGTDTLAVGVTGEITVTVVLDNLGNIGTATKTNTVDATGETPLGGKVGDDDDADLTIDDKGQISLAKAASVTYNDALDEYTVDFTFTISNTGDAPLKDVQITDAFKNGTDGLFDIATYGGTITVIGGTLEPNYNTGFNGTTDLELLASPGVLLGLGKTETLIIRVTGLEIPAGTTHNALNSATTDGTTLLGNDATDDSNDGVTPVNGDDEPTPVNFLPVALSKTVSAATANIGDVLTYTITATFPAGETVKNITITDLLPAGLEFATLDYTRGLTNATSINPVISASETIPRVDADKIEFTIEELTSAATGDGILELSFTAIVADDTANVAGEVIENSASLTYGEHGAPGTVSSNTVETTLTEPSPALEKTISSATGVNPLIATDDKSASNLDIGDTLEFSLAITQAGTDLGSGFGLLVEDTLPAGLTFLSIENVTKNGTTVAATEYGVTYTHPALAVKFLDTFEVNPTDEVVITYKAEVNTDTSNIALATATNKAKATLYSQPTAPTADNNRATTSLEDEVEIKIAQPLILVAKEANDWTFDGEDTFRISYTFALKNDGIIKIGDITLVDDLRATFGANATFSNFSVTVPTGSTLNPIGAGNYDGVTNTELLAPNSTLETGVTDYVTLEFDVTFASFSDFNGVTFNNIAIATPSTPGGVVGPEDGSEDGDTPQTPIDPTDPDQEDPTPLELEINPAIAVTKTVVDMVNHADGTYEVTFQIALANTGDTDLLNVQITDNLDTTFKVGTSQATAYTVFDPIEVTHSTSGDESSTAVSASAVTAANGWKLLQDSNGLELKRGDPTATDPSGESLTVTFTVGFTPPLGAPFTYDNVANGSAHTNIPDGPVPTDDSTTPFIVKEESFIGVSTSYDPITGLEDLGDGAYIVDLKVLIKNYGEYGADGVQLDNIQADFPLDDFFANAAHFEFVSIASSEPTFPVNPGYTGEGTDIGLFAPSITAILGAEGQPNLPNSVEVTVRVKVIPGGTLYYEAETEATATTPLGLPVSDESNDGGNPDLTGGTTTDPADADNDGDPTNNTAPTPILFPDEPLIGLAKSFEQTELRVTGNVNEFGLTFTFHVENYGNAQLNNVGIVDNFDTIFDDGSAWAVTEVRVLNGSVAPATGTALPTKTNPNGYQLLDTANSALASVAQAALSGATLTASATIEVDLVVTPATPGKQYFNTADASGTSPGTPGNPGGTTTTDTSHDGPDPDPDGNKDPGAYDDPTPFRFERPEITVWKDATSSIRPDGQMDVYYTFTIQNTGDVDLHDVQLTDNLATALGTGNYTLMSLYSTTLTVNALAPMTGGYDGATVTELLAGTDTIPTGVAYADPIIPGAAHTVHLHVVVKQPDGNGATNTATASGLSPALNPVDDDASFTVFPGEDPRIALAKSATVDLQADGTFNVDYRFVVKNVGDVQLHNVQIADTLQDLYASTDLTADKISRVYSELTYNTNFTGNTDPNLLTGVDTLEVGQEKTIIIRLSGITANHAGEIRNSALATGEGPYGGTTNDRSNDGLTPEPGADVPTKIILKPTTQIAIAKHSASQLRTDGTYDVTFTLNVANVGNSKLLGVQVRDTLEDFYAKTNLTASKISVSSSDFAVNPAFDGANDSDLLLGTDVLAVGANGIITINLSQLTPNTGVTAVENTAVASGRDATGKRTTDKSNDGVTPDPTDDTPTITPLSPQPQIGIAKRAGVTLAADGTYTAVFDLVLKNYGNTVIHNVQVTDDLAEFYSDAGLSASNITVTATGLSVNSSYNGQSNQNLLTGTDTLGLTETKTITITLTGLVVTPPKTILNTAIATGTDPSGTVPTEDRSTDGDDPDPDGNEDPTDNDVPTPVEFTENPRLGLAKDATVEPGSTDGFKITFEILVKNYGNTDLVGLMVHDDMAATLLDLAVSYDAPVVTSGDFTVNDTGTLAYDGAGNNELLTGVDTLPVGGEGTITIVIDNFVPQPAYSRGENSATGSGTPPTKPGDTPKPPVTDDSQNGKDPDPDNNGDPTDNNDPTPVEFTVDPPVVGIAKAAEVTEYSDGTFDVTLLFTVTNYSTEPVEGIQIRDDLQDLYDQTDLSASAISVSSPDFAVNSSYDGLTDVYVLAHTTGTMNALAGGATGTATVVIEGIRATGDQVEVFNTAIVTGTDPRTGRPITPDESTDGEDPDPDGDGDPHNNKTPTPILVHVAPKIGLAKAATVNAKGDGKHDITFTIRAVNYGDTELLNLSITDSLAEFYARTNLTPANVSVASTTFTTNPLYDGQFDTELLGSGNALKVGGEGTVTITLTDVVPASDVTRLYNSAFTTATTPGGKTVDDTSHDGHDPDPTGTNRPGDYNDPTPVDFAPVGSVLLEKHADRGNYEVGDKITYTITVANPHDVAISFTLIDTIPEYTLYITGSAVFSNDARIPLDGKEPRQKDLETLEWRSIVLPASEVLSITYELRILPGADGDLTNVVTIDGEDENYKRFFDRTTETVKVSQGIFDREKSTLIGRVFIDMNDNTIYDEGIDIPIEHARVILSNGWQTTTDGQGNYAFRNIDTGIWSVQLDERTAPYPTQRHPEQLRDRYQHRVSVSGLTVSDFPLIGVIGEIETDRETFVTFGPLTLHKYIVTGDEADTAVLTISTTEDMPAAILVTDPQPDGTTITYVVEPSAGAASTFTYDLPLGSQLTDPILEWSDL